MTVVVSVTNRRKTLGDQILKAVGKERRPVMPFVAIGAAYAELGPSAYLATECRWEGFWSVLLRRRTTRSG